MTRRRGRLLLALLLPALLLVPLAAAPVSAAGRYVACTWSASDHSDWKCGKAFSSLGAATYSTCWKHRPSSASYIQARFGGRWYTQTENATVRISRSSTCSSSYPWLTKLTVGVVADDLYAKQAYRLVMPATSQYTRTLYRFYVCVLPANSDGTCW
ncbi:MAG: hypothetical protein R2737_04060 [Candidatus Nanopelagicales bacterium]